MYTVINRQDSFLSGWLLFFLCRLMPVLHRSVTDPTNFFIEENDTLTVKELKYLTPFFSTKCTGIL